MCDFDCEYEYIYTREGERERESGEGTWILMENIMSNNLNDMYYSRLKKIANDKKIKPNAVVCSLPLSPDDLEIMVRSSTMYGLEPVVTFDAGGSVDDMTLFCISVLPSRVVLWLGGNVATDHDVVSFFGASGEFRRARRHFTMVCVLLLRRLFHYIASRHCRHSCD